MKRIYSILTIMATILVMTISCENEHTLYKGDSYIMFADTLNVLAIQNSEEIFNITVGATVKCDYDRVMGIEILDGKSNAIEGKHYELLSNTITIKAGENTADVQVIGNYENLNINDSLGFIISLISNEDTQWDMYDNNTTKVLLKKTKPFNINDFTGYAVVNSTFLYDYSTDMQRLITTEVDTTEDCTIILKDYIYDGYDIKIKFDTTDILNPLIKMEEQVMVSSGEAFGTIYGDGFLNIYQPAQYTSYYSTNETFIVQYMTVYVPGMAEGTNVVGTYINAVEWISDNEAEELKKDGY